MNEQQQTTQSAPLPERTAARPLPAPIDVERMVGLVLEAAATRARIWFGTEEAAELAQEIGFKFWQAWQANPGLFDAETVPVHWVSVAVQNAAIDRLRAAETRAFAEVQADPARDHAVESGDDPVGQAEALELGRHLAHALNALPARQREIWLRVRDRGQGYDEVAADLGIGRETVKTQMARAVHVLRNALLLHEGESVND